MGGVADARGVEVEVAGDSDGATRAGSGNKYRGQRFASSDPSSTSIISLNARSIDWLVLKRKMCERV